MVDVIAARLPSGFPSPVDRVGAGITDRPASAPLTFGVEEEFFVVDAATGALASAADRVLDAAESLMGDSVTSELNRCQIETASAVCTSTDQLRRDLSGLRCSLAAAAASEGLAVPASGTHPFSSWEDQEVNVASERFERMEEQYQAIARQQIICGCHVHVGIDDPDVAIDVMNRCRPWLPVLLALSANSPYWHGVDTGYASYRTQVWTRWPTAGISPTLADRAAYDDLVSELQAVDAIEDSTYLYWYARPSAHYPTLEFRIADVCTEVDDTVLLAALIRGLVWTCVRDGAAGVPPAAPSTIALDAVMWRAARYGLDGTLADPAGGASCPAWEVIDHMVSHVRDGLDAHGDRDLVVRRLDVVRERGNGATHQRRTFEDSGGDPRAVLRSLVERTAPGVLDPG